MPNEPLIDALRARLRLPLPGHGDFVELSGYQRPDLEEVMRREPAPKQSAVLILLHGRREEMRIILMERPVYDGVHSGQIAFPGGHREPEDADIRRTALREFAEETGADTSGVSVLGELTRVFIPPSNTIVTPVLGWMDVLGPTSPDPREVAALIDVPLGELLADDILKRRDQFVRVLNKTLNVPYWDVRGQVVWGATALMIAELRELIRSARA